MQLLSDANSSITLVGTNLQLSFMPLSQSTIKFISSLRQKKFRQSYHKFTVEGAKMVAELLQQDRFLIDQLYATQGWLDGDFKV
ncbi:MAG: hypothetical protein AAFU67_08435, partial [Bacteroidota bacterium]